MRVPEAPIGWPSAMAPPCALTSAGSTPSTRVDCTATAAKASLISIAASSSAATSVWASADSMARAGCECSETSGPATKAWARMRASGWMPRMRASSSCITTTAAAPSEICEELPAVIVPSFEKAGRSAASDSTVVSARSPSSVSTVVLPRRELTS